MCRCQDNSLSLSDWYHEAIGNGVGGILWCNVYSNESILKPFIVIVWVEDPVLCAKSIDDSRLLSASTRRKNNWKLPLREDMRSTCCVSLWLIIHKPCVWRDGCNVMYHTSGILSGTDSDSEAWVLSSVGRGVNKIITNSLLWCFITTHSLSG